MDNIYIFNSITETINMQSTVSMTFFDGKINTAWNTIKEEFGSYEDNDIKIIVTFNDSNHSLLANTNMTLSANRISLSYFQINQYGNKIKFPVDMMGIVGEAIFTKQ